MAQILVIVGNVAPAQKLGYATPGQKIHMRVLNGAGAILLRFAQSRELLDSPSPFFPDTQGYIITSLDGLVEVQWEGDIYAEGVVANAAPVQLQFGIE